MEDAPDPKKILLSGPQMDLVVVRLIEIRIEEGEAAALGTLRELAKLADLSEIEIMYLKQFCDKRSAK